MKTEYEITDEEILKLIKTGVLVLREDGVYKFHNGRRKYQRLVENLDRNGRAFINVGLRFRKRGMSKNKLIWMFAHRRVIPNGYDVHHKDYNNRNDAPDNLELKDSSENRGDNRIKQFEECCDFFNRKLAAQYGSKGDF